MAEQAKNQETTYLNLQSPKAASLEIDSEQTNKA
jgi:hypothetical protein